MPTPEEQTVLDVEAASEKAKAKILDELLADPEIRVSTLRALQKKHPETYMPEIRVMDAVETRVKAVEDKYAADKAAADQAKLQEKLEAQKAGATRGMSAEQVTELETMMTSRRIGDYGTARELYDLTHKPAVPSGASAVSRQVSMPTTLADIQKNPQRWARNQAREAIDDLNKKRDEANRA